MTEAETFLEEEGFDKECSPQLAFQGQCHWRRYRPVCCALRVRGLRWEALGHV